MAAAATCAGVDPNVGLSTDEARRRAAVCGANEIPEPPRRPPWRMLVEQFTDFMIVVLIAAAVISGVIGDAEDTVAIVVIVLLNGIIGFTQEYRAERAIAALKLLAAATATVRRDGGVVTLPAAQLVVGDIVLLEAGNIVPADLRLLEAVRLKIDESALTGESVPAEKWPAPLRDAAAPLGERHDMAYKGTIVTSGRSQALVVAIGPATELGKIASLLRVDDEHRTPLQLRLARFGQRLALGAIAICALVFVTGILRGEPAVRMFLIAISLAVAAIPEALPAVVTVALALGARTMARKHALIRRLPAVETLGSVTYICTDKTGTLTQNKMRVAEIFADEQRRLPFDAFPSDEPWSSLYRALALSNDAIVSGDAAVKGDPTEVALYRAAAAAGYEKTAQERLWPRVAELPFDADRKRMTTFHARLNEVVSFTKGAPETVVAQCRDRLTAGDRAPLHRRPILQQAEHMAADGLRVLAVACRTWPTVPSTLTPEDVECDLTLLGLVALIDPPRPEAGAAVAACRAAGITPVMVTGDHPVTARCIAAQLGIADDDSVMSGQELATLSREALVARVARIKVYARIAPEQKIRIISALQDRGEFVAMTGDGVNDAPALQRADIGVAMGMAGTDVAREAADMVLLDDNFASIVAAVREGRRIFDNIRKFVKYAVTCNAAEVWTIFLAPFLGLPIPLLPIHILWINLVTDGLPGLALALEPEERGIMLRPPRPPQESLFAHGLWQHLIWVGLLMASTTLFTQAWAYHTGSAHWQTMVFTVLALSQLGHALAVRSETQSLFRQGVWSNPWLFATVLVTSGLQLATVYVPSLTVIFKTQPLSAAELALSLVLSAVVFVAVEVEKLLVRRGWLYQTTAGGRRAAPV